MANRLAEIRRALRSILTRPSGSMAIVAAVLLFALMALFRLYNLLYFSEQIQSTGAALLTLLSGLGRDLGAAAVLALLPACAALPAGRPGPRLAAGLTAALLLGLIILYGADHIFFRYNSRRLSFEFFTLGLSELFPAVDTGLREAPLFTALALLVWLPFAWLALRAAKTTKTTANIQGGTLQGLVGIGILLTVFLIVLPLRFFSVEDRYPELFYGEQERNVAANLYLSRKRLANLPNFLSPEQAQKRVDRLLRPVPAGAPAREPTPRVRDIVLIVMEGVAAREFSPERAGTAVPLLHGASGKFLRFPNFYANGLRTRNGLVALVTGWPDIVDYSAVKTYAGLHRYSSIPVLLAAHGYRSTFLYGGDVNFEGYGAFLKRRGFSELIGQKELSALPRHANAPRSAFGGALHDDQVLSHLADSLARRPDKDDSARRFFLTLLLTTHTPFELPPGADTESAPAQGRYQRYLRTLRFSDQALGRFLQRAAKEGWGRETLIIITADHTHHINLPNALDFRVPFMMAGPGITAGVDPRVGAHVDLLPTLREYLGGGPVLASAGRSLLTHTPDTDGGFAFLSAGRSIALVDGCGAYFTRPEAPGVAPFFYPITEDFSRRCASLNDFQERRLDLLAYFQFTRNRMLRNEILPP